MRLLFCLCLLCQVVHAEVCQVTQQPESALPAKHSRIELPGQKAFLIVGLPRLPKEALIPAILLLNMREPDLETLNQMQVLLNNHKDLFDEYSKTKEFLRGLLIRELRYFVAVENEGNSFKQSQSLAEMNGPSSQISQTQKIEAIKPLRQQLLLMAVGPALFTKAETPDLFDGVDVFGLDIGPVVEAAKLEPPPPVQNAVAAKTKEVRAELRDNPRTLATFNKAVGDFDRNAFAGKSDRQIKSQILARVYSPAQKLIGDWIDVRLAERHKPKIAPATPLADIEDQLALILFEEDSGGAIFVQQESLTSTVRALGNACNRQFVP